MGTAKKQGDLGRFENGKQCGFEFPLAPTEKELTEARKSLGLPEKPRYKLPKRVFPKKKLKWAGEPNVIAGMT